MTEILVHFMSLPSCTIVVKKEKKNVINGTAKSEATSDLHCALCDPS